MRFMSFFAILLVALQGYCAPISVRRHASLCQIESILIFVQTNINSVSWPHRREVTNLAPDALDRRRSLERTLSRRAGPSDGSNNDLLTVPKPGQGAGSVSSGSSSVSRFSQFSQKMGLTRPEPTESYKAGMEGNTYYQQEGEHHVHSDGRPDKDVLKETYTKYQGTEPKQVKLQRERHYHYNGHGKTLTGITHVMKNEDEPTHEVELGKVEHHRNSRLHVHKSERGKYLSSSVVNSYGHTNEHSHVAQPHHNEEDHAAMRKAAEDQQEEIARTKAKDFAENREILKKARAGRKP